MEEMALERGLPVNIDAERFILGSVMIDDSRFVEIAGVITQEDFSLEKHRRIFQRMSEMNIRGEKIDRVTVANELLRFGELESVDGLSYLVSLDDGLPQISNLESYTRIIRDKSILRRIAISAQHLMNRALAGEEDPGDIIASAELTFLGLGEERKGHSTFVTFEDVVRECGGLDAFLARGTSSSVSYPWATLTQMTNGGMRPGQVIVIAGPSGQGKTALALNIAYHAARSSEGYPAIFSLEMQKEEIKTRLLAIASRVDSYHFRRLDEAERDRIRGGVNSLITDLVFTDDDDCGTVAAMRSKLKKKMAVQPISMVLIDYVQLIEGVKGVGETREQEIAKIMRGIKRMAMKLKLPFVVLSQMNQDATGTREPELKDLRESRSIGHNADLVAFLHFTRPYDIASGIPTGDLDLIIRKQRSGPEGRLKLRFHAPTGRFYELDTTAAE